MYYVFYRLHCLVDASCVRVLFKILECEYQVAIHSLNLISQGCDFVGTVFINDVSAGTMCCIISCIGYTYGVISASYKPFDNFGWTQVPIIGRHYIGASYYAKICKTYYISIELRIQYIACSNK